MIELDPVVALQKLLPEKEAWEKERKISLKSAKVTGIIFKVVCFKVTQLKSRLVAISCKVFPEDVAPFTLTSGRAQTVARGEGDDSKTVTITTTLGEAQGLAQYLQKLASVSTPSTRRIKVEHVGFTELRPYSNFGIDATPNEICDADSSGYETLQTSASESASRSGSLKRAQNIMISRVKQQQRIEKLEQNVDDLKQTNLTLQETVSALEKNNADLRATISSVGKDNADLRATISSVEKDNADLRATISSVGKDNADLRANFIALQDECKRWIEIAASHENRYKLQNM